MKFNIYACKIIELPKISDPRGNLTFVEGATRFPLISNGSTTFTTFQAALNVVVMPTKDYTNSSLPCRVVLMWCLMTGKTRNESTSAGLTTACMSAP